MEVIADCGFDWLFIEAEHAPIDAAAVERLLVAAGDTPCLVRLPNQDPVAIKRALDLGAAGIIVPQVNTVGEARAIVEAAVTRQRVNAASACAGQTVTVTR